MAENFGTGQPRVLNTEDRSIENVVFQYKTPPLTSEWNLINQVSNQKIKDFITSIRPSGWVNTGRVLDLNTGISENTALPGDVCTSLEYSANSFKLIGDSTALVNGWPIVLQDTLIELEVPTGDSYRYDFVFLEVWKKLVGENDPLYPYGNVNSVPYTDNELVYDVVGVETTKRVQIQYRIRTKKLNSPTNLKECFDVVNVYPIGGRTSAYEFTNYKFSAVGSKDPGLYVSGLGLSQDQTNLNTVDGYVYAIPMFLVYRRRDSSFSSGAIHSSTVTREDYLNGYRSDRTDQKLLDVVYCSDIVDQRHKIAQSMSDVSDAAEETFNKLVSGSLNTNLGKGFTNFLGGKSTYSGASTQLKIEQINGTGGNDIPNISSGESSSSSFKKRVYSNAAIKSYNNIVKVPVAATGGATWSAGSFDLSSYVPSASVAAINTVIGLYTLSLGEVTSASYSISTKEITIAAGSNIIGTTSTVYLHIDLIYAADNKGFRDVPKSALEINKAVNQPTAPSFESVYIRHNLMGNLLKFDGSGVDEEDGVTDERDYIANKGNVYSYSYDFGMDLVLHRPISSTTTFAQSLSGGKLYSYYVTGVKEVLENIGTKETPDWQPRSFTLSRIESSIETVNQSIDSYTLSNMALSDINAKEIKIVFSVSSKPELYVTGSVVRDSANALKFFNFNKQARGVTDVFEMIEAVAERTTGNLFVVDTIDKPILKIGSSSSSAYIYGRISADPAATYTARTSFTVDSLDSSEINGKLPILSSDDYTSSYLPTKLTIDTTGLNLVGDYIRVPLLVESYVSADEQPYSINYEFVTYQGLLSKDSEIKGKFVSESKALLTSKGSGAEDLFTLGTDTIPGGTADFTYNSTSIDLPSVSDLAWSQYLELDNATYFIRKKGSAVLYRIESLSTYTVVISENYRGTTGAYDYEIVRLDSPAENKSNIIDRLPTFVFGDFEGSCVALEYSGLSTKALFVDALSKINDPLSSPVNTFTIGDSSNTDNETSRGVTKIFLSDDAEDTIFNHLPKRPAIKYSSIDNIGTFYKKLFQPYLFIIVDDDKIAKPYLAVISGETGNSSVLNELNNYSNRDTIDLFELVGRPIIKI